MMINSLILLDDWSPSHRGDGTQYKYTQLKALDQREAQNWGSSERECGLSLEAKVNLPKERTFGLGFEALIGVCHVKK